MIMIRLFKRLRIMLCVSVLHVLRVLCVYHFLSTTQRIKGLQALCYSINLAWYIARFR